MPVRAWERSKTGDAATGQDAEGSEQRNEARRVAPDSDPSIRGTVWWIVAAVSASVFVIYAAVLSFHWQTDFEVYRTGGQHILASGLYAPRMVAPTDRLFTYPPLAAMIFWPISHLSRGAGQFTWDMTNVGALAALLACSSAGARRRSPTKGDWRLSLLALAPVGILLWPVHLGFDLGQINVILVLMIVADLTTDLSWRGRRLPRGALVGLAAAAKLTPLIFVPYLLLTRQWRVARNAIVTFVLATGCMVALAPSASWDYFTKYMFDVRRIGSSTMTANQTIRSATERMGIPASHVVVDLLVVLVFVGGLALATVAYRRSSPMLGMLYCAATGLLISPISWVHHYVWCVPLLVWLVVGVDRPRRGSMWAVVIALTLTVVPPPHPVGHSPLLDVRENVDVLLALVVMGLGGAMLWRRRVGGGRRPDGSTPPCLEGSKSPKLTTSR